MTKIRFKPPESGILLWIGVVSILAWGLVCLLYPGAAIVFVLGIPLGKLALELSDPSPSRKQERVTCKKENKGEKPWKESGIKRGGKQLGVLNLLIVVLIALCLLYPDAAIFNKLGIPLQW